MQFGLVCTAAHVPREADCVPLARRELVITHNFGASSFKRSIVNLKGCHKLAGGRLIETPGIHLQSTRTLEACQNHSPIAKSHEIFRIVLDAVSLQQLFQFIHETYDDALPDRRCSLLLDLERWGIDQKWVVF
jgi:hypothetical protein